MAGTGKHPEVTHQIIGDGVDMVCYAVFRQMPLAYPPNESWLLPGWPTAQHSHDSGIIYTQTVLVETFDGVCSAGIHAAFAYATQDKRWRDGPTGCECMCRFIGKDNCLLGHAKDQRGSRYLCGCVLAWMWVRGVVACVRARVCGCELLPCR